MLLPHHPSTRIFPFEKDKYNRDESVPPNSHPLYNM